MSDNLFLHATLVVLNDCGILLSGKSGSGKSDLALQLIEDKNAALVADDVVYVEKKENEVIGKCAPNLAGMLEVRGLGIVKYPYIKEAKIKLWVNLVDDIKKLQRMPKKQTECILGLEIDKIDLYAKENSALAKIAAALRCVAGYKKKAEEKC